MVASDDVEGALAVGTSVGRSTGSDESNCEHGKVRAGAVAARWFVTSADVGQHNTARECIYVELYVN